MCLILFILLSFSHCWWRTNFCQLPKWWKKSNNNNNNISIKIEITPRNEVLLLKKMRIYSLLFFCWVIKLSFQSFYDRGLARIFGHWAKMTWQIHTFASLFTQIKSNRIWKPILKLKRMKKKLQLYIFKMLLTILNG